MKSKNKVKALFYCLLGLFLISLTQVSISATLTVLTPAPLNGNIQPKQKIPVLATGISGDQDWVGVYKKGDSNDWANVISWAWIDNNNELVSITGVPEKGDYEARLFFHNTFDIKANYFFRVGKSDPGLSTTDRTQFQVNESMTLYPVGLSGDRDWIAIYHKGDSNDWANIIKWIWVENPRNTHLNVPNQTGKYEARLFFHNSYTVEASMSFDVVNGPSIKASKTNYKPKERLYIEASGLSGDRDWVGIYHKGDSNDWNNVVKWYWVKTTSNITLNGLTQAGNYDARLFFHNTYQKRAQTSFRVGNADAGKKYPPETELTKIPVEPRNRPAEIGASYTDVAFDNTVKRTVTRVTNREQDKLGSYGHQYPKQGSAWNSDMSLLRIGQRIYDAKTLEELPVTKGQNADTVMYKPKSGASGIRWSKHKPNILYVMSGNNKFYELTLNADKTEVTAKIIYDLDQTGISNFTIGHDEGNIDYADRYVVLSATSNNDDIYSVLLDIKNKRLVWGPRKLQYKANNFDWISISPSGKYILASYVFRAQNDNHSWITLYDAKTFNEIKEKFTQSAQHGDMGKTADNEDIWVQWENSGKHKGYVLKNQREILLSDTSTGSGHVSCRNYKLKNWCYVSSAADGYREVFALKLDGSMKVRRFAKTYARGPEDPRIGNDEKYYYSTLPTGVPSPDGTKVLFWSDFGNPEQYLYYYKSGGLWKTTDHYYARDTYQVTIE